MRKKIKKIMGIILFPIYIIGKIFNGIINIPKNFNKIIHRVNNFYLKKTNKDFKRFNLFEKEYIPDIHNAQKNEFLKKLQLAKNGVVSKGLKETIEKNKELLKLKEIDDNIIHFSVISIKGKEYNIGLNNGELVFSNKNIEGVNQWEKLEISNIKNILKENKTSNINDLNFLFLKDDVDSNLKNVFKKNHNDIKIEFLKEINIPKVPEKIIDNPKEYVNQIFQIDNQYHQFLAEDNGLLIFKNLQSSSANDIIYFDKENFKPKVEIQTIGLLDNKVKLGYSNQKKLMIHINENDLKLTPLLNKIKKLENELKDKVYKDPIQESENITLKINDLKKEISSIRKENPNNKWITLSDFSKLENKYPNYNKIKNSIVDKNYYSNTDAIPVLDQNKKELMVTKNIKTKELAFYCHKTKSFKPLNLNKQKILMELNPNNSKLKKILNFKSDVNKCIKEKSTNKIKL